MLDYVYANRVILDEPKLDELDLVHWDLEELVLHKSKI